MEVLMDAASADLAAGDYKGLYADPQRLAEASARYCAHRYDRTLKLRRHCAHPPTPCALPLLHHGFRGPAGY